MAPFGIYIHWPFCETKCPYCDFNSHVRENINQDTWCRAYQAELKRYATETGDRTVTSIFFGGGTPSLMAPETICALNTTINHYWPTSTDLEVTMEANPSTSELDKFRSYRAAGINRISIGVQSLNDASLIFLGRRHTVSEAIAAAKMAEKVFDRFSIDMIYALPGQTVETWCEELHQAIKLSGDHISVYQLTIEKGTEFYKQRVLDVNQDLGAKFFECTRATLEAAGLPPYEISNHAQPGYECRHNLLYWWGEDYIGIGPGAHGRLRKQSHGVLSGTEAIQEISLPENWLNGVNNRGSGTQRRYKLNFEERLEELILAGLRLSSGIDSERFFRLTGRDLFEHLEKARLENLVNQELLILSPRNLRLTTKGQKLLNSVIRVLLI